MLWAAGRLCGAPVDGSLSFTGASLDPQAGFLAALLQSDASVRYSLPGGDATVRDAQGRWNPDLLREALLSQGPLGFHGDADMAAARSKTGSQAPWSHKAGPGSGVRLSAQGLPRVVLLENSSTVSPLSKGLQAWGWPCAVHSFAEVEADPGKILDPASEDLVVFSSPGWWGDFADPPGGPSRLGEPVAAAVRNFVHQGGTALFIDIAQWDLEKVWPNSLSLAPLGPYAVSKLNLGAVKGGVSLSPVGVAADKLRSRDAFTLLGRNDFEYPDGGVRPVHAAWAMPDPSGGQGWTAGFAFHVFDQDDTLALPLRRLLLNTLLLSGARRISVQGETPPPSPIPLVDTATPAPTLTSAPTATQVPPSPTPVPSLPPPTVPPTTVPTPLPTPDPSPFPTTMPTLVPTPIPPATPTAVPTPVPTAIPTAIPSPVPTRIPTAVPTQPPTEPPTPFPSPVPTPYPSPTPPPVLPKARPVAVVPTAQPWPSPPPPAPLPMALPTAWPAPPPVPTLIPTRWSPPPPTATLPPPPPVLMPDPTAWATAMPAPTRLVPDRRSTPRPRPTRTPTLRRRRPARIPRPRPTPTTASTIPPAPAPPLLPRPTVVLRESIHNALGCLSSAPEPFSDGGAYIQFCLSHTAMVHLAVFDATGAQRWRSEDKLLSAGQQQWYFSGNSDEGPLPPGAYGYEVTAIYGAGQGESRQGGLTKVRAERR
jgi:hypothetical protein